MTPESRGWTAVAELRAAEVLDAMGNSGFRELHDQMVLFFRALALEVGDAITSGKTPPGLPMEIDEVIWYSVAVPREGVFFSYSIYPGERQIRICDLIWITFD
ncbi:hypothetical protein [Actinacidiphila acididurans]|uniref:Uncharacterized protein n=1 Tax=Actinacidiphila acididurans TaxID=2784346 RepID=A0ABS2U623_9ACTN|nr:hypothetical protein [Actinacidiphila acididurans]MBM9510472.1 hypothetical protein [Actinacidiphila acididurans]